MQSLHLINNHKKMARPHNCIRNHSLFSDDPDSVSALSRQCFLRTSEVCSLWFMSVSKRRWLICDCRREAGEPAIAGNNISRTVPLLVLVWSICWAFLNMVSWQMEGFFFQRHTSFGAGTTICWLQHLRSFVSNIVWTHQSALSPAPAGGL